MRRLKNPEIYFDKYINTGSKKLRVLGNMDDNKFAKVTPDDLAKMTPAEKKKFTAAFDKFFADSRLHGLDGSISIAVGGSDQAIINGFGYKGNTPSTLYAQKVLGYKKPLTKDDRMRFDTGHRAEEYIAESFEQATGLPVIHWPLQIVNEKWPHCVANVDGLVIEDGKIGIYEGKCPQAYSSQLPWMTMAKYKNSPENIDFVPIGYRLQVWFYLAVYELDFAYICGGGWGYRHDDIGYCKIMRLPKEEEDALMENAESFVTDYCLKRIRPSDVDVSIKESILAAYGDLYYDMKISNTPVKLDPSFAATFEKALEMKSESDEIEKKLEELKKEKKRYDDEYNACLAALSEAFFGSNGGKIEHDGKEYTIFVSLGTPKDKVDIDKLEQSYPEIYKEVKRKPEKIDMNLLETKYPMVYADCFRKTTRTLKYKLEKKAI